MEKIIEKMDSYNIFNYLLPGAIFDYMSIHKFGSLLWFFDNFIQKFYFEWKNLDGN